MGGSWGTIVIGVKMDSFEEVRILFAKLGKYVTIDEVRDYDALNIEKWFDLSDHPLNPAHKKKYGRDAYKGDFEIHFDHEHGEGWTDDKTHWLNVSDVVIGVRIYDSYGETDEIPLEYISKKLAELKKVLATASVYMTHVHS